MSAHHDRGENSCSEPRHSHVPAFMAIAGRLLQDPADKFGGLRGWRSGGGSRIP
jgi:hypothetical protein